MDILATIVVMSCVWGAAIMTNKEMTIFRIIAMSLCIIAVFLAKISETLILILQLLGG